MCDLEYLNHIGHEAQAALCKELCQNKLSLFAVLLSLSHLCYYSYGPRVGDLSITSSLWVESNIYRTTTYFSMEYLACVCTGEDI